jgi:hypothetical protein
MSWYDALDAKTELAQFWTSKPGHSFATGWQKSNLEKYGCAALEPEVMCALEAGKMKYGAPMWISGEVKDLIVHAAESFQPEPFVESDLFIAPGFAILGTPGDGSPLIVYDSYAGRAAARAIAWAHTRAVDMGTGKERDGVHFSIYSHDDDVGLDDFLEPYLELKKMGGAWAGETKWSLFHHTQLTFGLSFEQEMADTQAVVDALPETGDRLGRLVDPAFRQYYAGLWATLQTFFRMMAQKVAVVQKIDAPRGVRKRAIRRDVENLGVLVVRLRRESVRIPKENGEGKRELHYRHYRVGHWRNQFYPSLKMHRQVWIEETIVGDESLPLLLHPSRAYSWTR